MAEINNRSVEGLRQLSDQLLALGAETGIKALRSATMRASLPVLREARARAPIGDRAHLSYKGKVLTPGYLSRNIIRKSKVDKRRGAAYVDIGPEREAFYGSQFVELGTSKMDAQEWLVPAFEAKELDMLNRLREMLKKAIAKAAAKR